MERKSIIISLWKLLWEGKRRKLSGLQKWAIAQLKEYSVEKSSGSQSIEKQQSS